MSESLIETIARALHDRDERIAAMIAKRYPNARLAGWEDTPDAAKETWRHEAAAALAAIEPLLEAMRRHIRSYPPGTLVGSEANVALHLRDLDGEIWEPWCQPGDISVNAAAEFRDLVQMVESSGTHVVCPVEPTQEQQVFGVEAMAAALEPFAAKLKADGRGSDAITLSVISSGHITGPVYRAMLAARPRDV